MSAPSTAGDVARGNATLAESPIDILLWKIALNSHFADTAEAEPFSSSAVVPRPSFRRRSRAPPPSIGVLLPADDGIFVQIGVSITPGWTVLIRTPYQLPRTP